MEEPLTPQRRRDPRRGRSRGRRQDGTTTEPSNTQPQRSRRDRDNSRASSTASSRTKTRTNPPVRSANNARPSSNRKPVIKEDTRLDELEHFQYCIASVPQITLINSSNKAKIYKVDIQNEHYKVTIPILKSLPIQLQSLPEKPSNGNVIKNFNSKVRAKDNSLKFYLNCLVNDHQHLLLTPTEYRLYESSKQL